MFVGYVGGEDVEGVEEGDNYYGYWDGGYVLKVKYMFDV